MFDEELTDPNQMMTFDSSANKLPQVEEAERLQYENDSVMSGSGTYHTTKDL